MPSANNAKSKLKAKRLRDTRSGLFWQMRGIGGLLGARMSANAELICRKIPPLGADVPWFYQGQETRPGSVQKEGKFVSGR